MQTCCQPWYPTIGQGAHDGHGLSDSQRRPQATARTGHRPRWDWEENACGARPLATATMSGSQASSQPAKKRRVSQNQAAACLDSVAERLREEQNKRDEADINKYMDEHPESIIKIKSFVFALGDAALGDGQPAAPGDGQPAAPAAAAAPPPRPSHQILQVVLSSPPSSTSSAVSASPVPSFLRYVSSPPASSSSDIGTSECDA